MKLFMTSVLMVVSMLDAYGQNHGQRHIVGVSAGMGVSAHSAPSIVDYVNVVAQPSQRVDEFTTSIEFFVAPEIQINEDWSIALEYGYHLKSYGFDNSSGLGRVEFTHRVHLPTLLLHYLMPGEAYWFKLGGGLGYHNDMFEESFSSVNRRETYRGSGIGAKVEAVGNTAFDESFYGSIGVDMRWVFGGSFKDHEGKAARYNGFSPKMGFFSAGLKFGVMILF
ncbi:MAG TPA: hypothetical protein VNN76_02375 [Bacteroidota bacterium]|nr:hypothetical protein [Bacteroidota bacterium]